MNTCIYAKIDFIDFMLKGNYTYLLSPNDYERNDKIILKHFSVSKRMKKLYCVICGRYRKFEKT